ncbi:MAG: class I SAM-dependent methyltransferase [Acidiferrobacterales bacterium]
MNKNKAEVFNVPSFSDGMRSTDVGCGPGHVREHDFSMRPVCGLDRQILKLLLKTIGSPPVRFLLWNGEEVSGCKDTPIARVYIADRMALLRLIVNPDLYFGECYSSGRLDVEGDLVEFIESVYRASAAVPDGSLIQRLISRTGGARPNTPAGSRDNIHRHYDIGNDFYRLWLDEQMVYTCAYFTDSDATLEQAQVAKMDHVCRKLRLRAGETVVEAGCGWGSLARHMARRYGVRVMAYNISHEQVMYARELAKNEGLEGLVEYVEDDYRNISGHFDAFVSVGMLEHVGIDHYHELGDVIHRCLRNSGRGLIHSIGRNRAMPMNAWIEKRIFPGAYPPTLGEMMQILEPWEYSVLDVENLRLHYARTLEHWLWRFEKASDRVAAMFDESFVRAWRLYLAGSVAAFRASEMQLFQVVFAPRNNNNIPWTREHIYIPDVRTEA